MRESHKPTPTRKPQANPAPTTKGRGATTNTRAHTSTRHGGSRDVYATTDRQCVGCGAWFTPSPRERNPRKWCTERCRTLHKRWGVPAEDLPYVRVLRRDPCSYCGAPSEALDHIVPQALDGGHDWSNLTAVCSTCNQRKGPVPLLQALLLMGFLDEIAEIRQRMRPLAAYRAYASVA